MKSIPVYTILMEKLKNTPAPGHPSSWLSVTWSPITNWAPATSCWPL